jgi:hypothetical protein
LLPTLMMFFAVFGRLWNAIGDVWGCSLFLR